MRPLRLAPALQVQESVELLFNLSCAQLDLGSTTAARETLAKARALAVRPRSSRRQGEGSPSVRTDGLVLPALANCIRFSARGDCKLELSLLIDSPPKACMKKSVHESVPTCMLTFSAPSSEKLWLIVVHTEHRTCIS